MGVAGSGKSTVGSLLAASLHWDFLEADAFHPPANIEKMSRGIPLTDADRSPWLHALRDEICRHLAEERNAVLACSALKAQYRRLLTPDPERVRLVYLKGPFSLFQERLARRRHHFMPASLLKSQFDTLEEPSDALTVDAAKAPDELVTEIQQKLCVRPP